MTAEAVTYSVNPRQRRGLLASALCVADFHYNITALSHLRSSAHHRQLRIIDRTPCCTAPSWADDRGSGHVFSYPPRQRRWLLASALCVAEHHRWSSDHHRHHIKQTADSRRYALRRCATAPEKHPIKTFFVRENPQWIPRSTRLCRFLVRNRRVKHR